MGGNDRMGDENAGHTRRIRRTNEKEQAQPTSFVDWPEASHGIGPTVIG